MVNLNKKSRKRNVDNWRHFLLFLDIKPHLKELSRTQHEIQVRLKKYPKKNLLKKIGELAKVRESTDV